MLLDILEDDNIHLHPQLIRQYTNFESITELHRFIEFKFLTYCGAKVSKEHLQRVRYLNRGRFFLQTPCPVPHWELHLF